MSRKPINHNNNNILKRKISDPALSEIAQVPARRRCSIAPGVTLPYSESAAPSFPLISDKKEDLSCDAAYQGYILSLALKLKARKAMAQAKLDCDDGLSTMQSEKSKTFEKISISNDLLSISNALNVMHKYDKVLDQSIHALEGIDSVMHQPSQSLNKSVQKQLSLLHCQNIKMDSLKVSLDEIDDKAQRMKDIIIKDEVEDMKLVIDAQSQIQDILTSGSNAKAEKDSIEKLSHEVFLHQQDSTF